MISLLAKHGAQKQAVFKTESVAAVAFEIGGIRVRFEMGVPTAKEFWPASDATPPKGWRGWATSHRMAWCAKQASQVERQRWRALLLVTKAKFEIIAEGLSTVEREFLADIVLPSGNRVETWLQPQILKALSSGKMPPLLGSGT